MRVSRRDEHERSCHRRLHERDHTDSGIRLLLHRQARDHCRAHSLGDETQSRGAVLHIIVSAQPQVLRGQSELQHRLVRTQIAGEDQQMRRQLRPRNFPAQRERMIVATDENEAIARKLNAGKPDIV
jgi:hypothetical protein